MTVESLFVCLIHISMCLGWGGTQRGACALIIAITLLLLLLYFPYAVGMGGPHAFI